MSQINECLSVVVPCFNEQDTILEIIEQVLAQPAVSEILIIDDGSTDNTRKILSSLENPKIRVIFQDRNYGKGRAVQKGFQAATKPYVIIQDADLEYSPNEYNKLLRPLILNFADVVFGSRFLTSGERRALYFWHRLGNSLLTLFSNMATNLDLTDMETCYKVMRTEIAKSLNLQEKRFGIEPEITAKVARRKLRIYEVPISYYGRTYEEGKKIGWKDGFSAIRCIVKYNLQKR